MRWFWDRTNRAIARVRRISKHYDLDSDLLVDALKKVSLQLDSKVFDIKHVNFGGVNNQGMFLHYGENKSGPIAITKLHHAHLAAREYQFMHWSNECDLSLTAIPISYQSLNDQFAITSTSFLTKPQTYLPTSIHELHHRLMNAVSSNERLGCYEALRAQVIPDTPIRSVLNELVSEPDPAKMLTYVESFFHERRSLIEGGNYSKIRLLAQYFSSIWQELYRHDLGLVHGDFKSQNILIQAQGDYRAIDLQYYLMGMRTWDLSFYYSKYDQGFEQACRDFTDSNQRYNTANEALFTFFYIIAVCLKIKPKKKKYINNVKILPAIQFLESHINDQNK